MKTTLTNEQNRYGIWSESDKFDDNAMRSWWEEQLEIDADDVTENDLAECLGIDTNDCTPEQSQALTTLIPAYVKAQAGSEPDFNRWCALIDDYFNDEMENLNKEVNGYIVGISDAGRWDGRASGFGKIGYNIQECIYKVAHDDCYTDIWAEADGLHISAAHHDGTNYYLFRICAGRDEADELEEQFYNLLEKGATRQEIGDWFIKNTTSLFPDIASIYGWN